MIDSSTSKRADLMARMSDFFRTVGGWSYDHRWIVLALAAAMTLGSLAVATGAQVDNSYETYFDPRDEAYATYERYRDDFGSDEVSYILYEAPSYEHGPWNLEVMRKIVALTDALEDEVPFLYEVQSLANAELMVGTDDGIDITLLRDDFPETQDELLALRDRYLAKPLFIGGILSADAQHAAIVIEMDRSSTDPPEEIRLDPEGGNALDNLYPQVTDTAIDAILARPEYEGISFYHSGDVPMNAAYNWIIGEESGFLQLVTAGVIALLLLFFFRSAVGVIGPILVVQLTVLMVVAFLTALGWKLGISFGSAPTLLTAIAVAHSVHILSEFRGRFADLGDRRTALVETIGLVGAPCLLTSVTTAFGFLSMAFVPIPSLAQMAVFQGFGVLAAFVLSFTVLMALLSFGRRVPKQRFTNATRERAKGGARMQKSLAAIASFVIRRRVAVLSVFAVVFLASGAGMLQLVVDSNWLDDFHEGMPLRVKAEHIDEVMGGVTNLVLLFDSGEAEAVKEPAVLRDIERLQDWADAQELVRKTYSIVDIVKDLNQSFHEDDPSAHRLPDSRNLVAQYLLLYESAGGTEGDEHVSSDWSRAALELRLRLAPTSHTATLIEDLERELEARPLEATTLKVTGIGALWVKLMDYIVWSQVQGFLVAFAVIALLMCTLFASVRTGLVSMIPNLSPVILALGVMGWTGIPLDYNKVMIAAVAMGIAVDDTIHLMSRFRHEFERLGRYEDALRAALDDVGRALWITSVALVCGFLVLLLSSLASNATQGLLLAIAIVTALVADFLLMPALVLTFEPFGPEGQRRVADEPVQQAA